MLIGILSDSHDHADRMERAVQRLLQENVTVLIHCGDLCGPAMLKLFPDRPAYFVLGNNDWPEDFAELEPGKELTCLGNGGIITLMGKTIAITHGHLPDVTQQLLAQQPDYLLSGHTHQREDRLIGPTRKLNPGALTRAREYTVAVLNLLTGTVRSLVLAK